MSRVSVEELALMVEAVRLGRLALAQLELRGLDTLPPELRDQLLAERDEVNAGWQRLLPK